MRRVLVILSVAVLICSAFCSCNKVKKGEGESQTCETIALNSTRTLYGDKENCKHYFFLDYTDGSGNLNSIEVFTEETYIVDALVNYGIAEKNSSGSVDLSKLGLEGSYTFFVNGEEYSNGPDLVTIDDGYTYSFIKN